MIIYFFLKYYGFGIIDDYYDIVIGGNYYSFMIADDFTKLTWTIFLAHNGETFKKIVRFSKLDQNQSNFKIIFVSSDHGGEFVNHHFKYFCYVKGITRNFSCSHTP